MYMGIPGSLSTRKKTKAKRSRRTRQRRIMLRPPDYNKVRLTTASGRRSLTIRYRRGPSVSRSNCANSGSTSFTAAHILASVDQVEPWIVAMHIGSDDQSLGKTYGHNSNMEDENQTFEDLAELPKEYGQISRCVSGLIPSNAACAVKSNDSAIDAPPLLPITSYHSCSSDMNESKISDDESTSAILADQIYEDPDDMSSKTFSEQDSENSNSFAAFEEMQHHSQSWEAQNADHLTQHLKFFNADDIDVNSTLLFMEAHEQLGARFWSLSQSESSLTDLSGTLAEEDQFDQFPPLLNDEMEREVFELPPLPRYRTVDTISLQDSTAMQRYEIPYENDPANYVDVNSSTEEIEPFDESTFLLLDQGTPDFEVNLATSDMQPQSADKGTFLFESALQGIEKVELQDPIKESGATVRVEELIISSTDKTARKHSELLEPASSVGQANSMLCSMDTGTTFRCKNKRKTRLRRATPLHILKSLLSCSADHDGPSASNYKKDRQIFSSDSVSSDSFSSDIAKVALIRDCPLRKKSFLSERAVYMLYKWFDDHLAFPFADKEEKLELVSRTGLTLKQVGNWLSNHRHKLNLKKSDFLVRDAVSPDI